MDHQGRDSQVSALSEPSLASRSPPTASRPTGQRAIAPPAASQLSVASIATLPSGLNASNADSDVPKSGTDFCQNLACEISNQGHPRGPTLQTESSVVGGRMQQPLTHTRTRDRDTFTDFTLICGTDRHRVHKLVICTQSKLFNAACTGAFKEASSNEFDMPEDDPIMVSKMVEHPYSGRYEVGADSATQQGDESGHDVADSRVHARMFALADKYDIAGLLQFCEN
ncbi:hypothetical protein B0T14DRAFT_259281 [Immersiella caudata]|uniref:BTB domain-containing protein n=1 Tax=Immersiella caudata TaxID=314043 RepID=A0AA39WKP8_9PEZI|nr:hypothetical protein B0T14DRAFT_259281 [Immersiella caudata]